MSGLVASLAFIGIIIGFMALLAAGAWLALLLLDHSQTRGGTPHRLGHR